jgi:hypothetical protein
MAENAAYKREIERLQYLLSKTGVTGLEEIVKENEVCDSKASSPLIHLTTRRPVAQKRLNMTERTSSLLIPENLRNGDGYRMPGGDEQAMFNEPTSSPPPDQPEQEQLINVLTHQDIHDAEKPMISSGHEVNTITEEEARNRSPEHQSYIPPKPGTLGKSMMKGFRIFGDYNPEAARNSPLMKSKAKTVASSPESESYGSSNPIEGLDNARTSLSSTHSTSVGEEEKLRCREWIERTTGEKLEDRSLEENLRDGIVLCR